MSITLLDHFAQLSRFADPAIAAAAHTALVAQHRDPDVLQSLTRNPHLHPDATRAVIERCAPAPVARRVARIAAGDSALGSRLVAVERRDGVLAVYAASSTDADLCAQLLNRGPNTRTALAANRLLPLDLRVMAARSGTALWARLRVAGDCTEEVISDDEVWGWLTEAGNWPKRHSPRNDVSRILWLRPHLLDRIVTGTPTQLVMAAAGSPRLVGAQRQQQVLKAALVNSRSNPNTQPWALLSLTANPRIDANVVDAATVDLGYGRQYVEEQINYRIGRPQVLGSFSEVPSAQLRWLMNRATPGTYGDGRPAEMLDLLDHPDLADQQIRIIDALAHLYVAHPAWSVELESALRRYVTDEEVLRNLLRPANDDDDNVGYELDWVVDPLSDAELDQILQRPIHSNGTSVIAGFCQHAASMLGEDRSRWETMWSIIHDLDSGTQIGDLIGVAAKL